ncbi:hypothetical protein [Novipirellula caenicola]|uniref:Uncharacterized protein n=1 Tax=Novipirellula caenicola TaxID=1536901 RepID=A0ABP9VMT2_9BACT
MQVNPSSAAANIAGTARAAARGGEADSQAAEATKRQATAENPGGKTAEASAIDSSEQTHDRGGDGRQMYDTFERAKEHDEQETQPEEQPGDEHDAADPNAEAASTPQEPPPHIDFNA